MSNRLPACGTALVLNSCPFRQVTQWTQFPIVFLSRLIFFPRCDLLHVRARALRICINVAYSVTFMFSSFVDCMVKVRVSSKVRVSVSFIFYCSFCFAMYVKRQKINTRVSCLGSSVVTVFALHPTGACSNPVVRNYFLTFFSSFFSKSSVNYG